jgi:four helix bundle protein
MGVRDAVVVSWAMRQLESLEAWKVARRVRADAYRLTLQAPLRPHFVLADQIRHAAASVPANLAEGYALGTRRQLVRCLRIAFGSTAELSTHRQLLADLRLLDPSAVRPPRDNSTRPIRLLVGLLTRYGAKPMEG